MDKWRLSTRWFWALIIAADIVLVYLNTNTYDSGDSILHYLYSKQAFHYPKYFMDHWAKPVFVLLSAPFAYWGWEAMKLFNTVCILASTYFTFLLFKQYNFNKWYAVLLCFAAPQFFLVQSSGLTEPLFTLFLIAIIYYLKEDKIALAMLLLSFLPFIRSEGWVISLILFVYLVANKKLKYSPIILIGSIVYGIIGLFYYQDFMWMFHQNPYSGVETKYGSGAWMHYIDQLPYVIGFPLFMFLLLGLYDGFYRALKGQMSQLEFFAIYGIVIGYIVAHTIFWAEGLFHSFGLNRVLIVLVPLITFIAYRGIERVVCAFSFISSKYIWFASAILLSVFPFTKNKAGLGLPESINKEPLQQMIDSIKLYTNEHYGNNRPIYYGNTYIPMSYNKDVDNSKEANRIGLLKEYDAHSGSLVLWDSYFAVTDQNISTEELRNKKNLKFIQRFNCDDCRKSYFIDLYLAE